MDIVKRRQQVAAFILAGGASSRMGRDKGFLEFEGVPLIVHTAYLIEPLVESLTVVGPRIPYAALGLTVIEDQVAAGLVAKKDRLGPLAGIATALAATRLPWNLIVACDLPYLTGSWLDWLLSRAVDSPGEVVIPQTERGLEPLAAVYRRECGAAIASALARGARKVTSVIEELRLDIVDPSEWRRIDPQSQVLKNMNTPGDYDEALKWWRTGRLSGPPLAKRARQARRHGTNSATLKRK
jgi:molybdopterin-guanine dinucleotide biosynthesis protein A